MSSAIQTSRTDTGDSAVEEWLELESDPGVFSLLIEDYGVRGVKVEEVYDITQKFDTVVFGFVFLFRYELSDRRARKKARDLSDVDSYVLDSSVVNQMFFAHQIITNSCATHALLSVLLNCEDVDIGPNLTRLREFTNGLDPESKGFAIANMMELAHIHNKHARPLRTMAPPIGGRKSSIVSSAFALLPETYHYVSFVPINGRLFELDGLKEFPIDHGPWGDQEKWTDLFQRTVSKRFLASQDCLFNLMALIPDPVPQISERLKKLLEEQTSLLEGIAELAQRVKTKEQTDEPASRSLGELAANTKDVSEQHHAAEEKDLSSMAEQTSNVDSGEPTQANSIEDLKNRPVADRDGDASMVESEPKKSIKEEMDVEVPLPKTTEEKTENEKEEAMEESTPDDSVATLLGKVSRGLPTEASELDAIADTSVSSSTPLDESLRISVAKVVKNYRETDEYKLKLKEEVELKQRFRIEHSRRIHDYDSFIFDFVKCLAHNKQLPDRLLRRPSVAPPSRGGVGKRKRNGVSRKPKTTLLLNGSEVG